MITIVRSRPPNLRTAFTLIELLVVIAVIALLVGILLPALAGARESSRRAVCLANVRQVGTSMSLYTSDFKSWFPVMPWAASGLWTNQYRYGGVAGLFSLQQDGDGQHTGFPGSGSPMYVNGNTQPLMEAYIEGFGVLTCPSDKEDLFWTYTTPPASRRYTSATARLMPQAAGSPEQVVSYNISYLYIAGFKTDEPVIVNPAPLFGDEANASDIGRDSWWGNMADAQAAGTDLNYFAREDNHGKDGANYVYTDTHAEFAKGNVAASFFTGTTNPHNVNAVDPSRSNRLQTID